MLARWLRHPLFEGIALAGIARARVGLGERDAAEAPYRQALEIVRSTKTPKIEAMILTDFARLLNLLDEPGEALEQAGAALRIYEGLDFPPGKADALLEASLARHERGERAAAVRDAEQARDLCTALKSPKGKEAEEQLRRWREEGHA